MLIGIVVLTLVAIPAVCSQEVVGNGDFEQGSRLSLPDWSLLPGRGQVRLENSYGWQKLTVTFDSGPCQRLSLYLHQRGGGGTVWYDDVSIPLLDIANPSFEEWEGNQPVGWERSREEEEAVSAATMARQGARRSRAAQFVDGNPSKASQSPIFTARKPEHRGIDVPTRQHCIKRELMWEMPVE